MAEREEETERRCIVTRNVAPTDELIRFVADPEGWIVADLKGNLPGRGAWVSARAQLVAEAERKNLFARSLKTEVKVAPGLADRVGDLLAAAALNTLSLARKAGLLVSGFAKVEAAIAGGRVVGLVHASDAAADGIRKIEQAVRRAGRPAPAGINQFTSRQLNLALGGTNVIHAALLAGRLSHDVLKRVALLARYHGSSEPQGVGPLADPTDTPRLPLGHTTE